MTSWFLGKLSSAPTPGPRVRRDLPLMEEKQEEDQAWETEKGEAEYREREGRGQRRQEKCLRKEHKLSQHIWSLSTTGKGTKSCDPTQASIKRPIFHQTQQKIQHLSVINCGQRAQVPRPASLLAAYQTLWVADSCCSQMMHRAFVPGCMLPKKVCDTWYTVQPQ